MTRRRIAVVLVAALAVVLGWRWHAADTDTDAPAASGTPAARTIDPDFQAAIARGREAMGRSGTIRPGFHIPAAADGNVAISGKVVDAESHAGVGGVEVVFRSPLGESSTTSTADGTYRIEVLPGVYRAFVRDDAVLSVGRPDHQRLPRAPSADAAGVPDEGLIPLVIATADTTGLDLSVLRGGELDGRVVDSKGRPVGGVVLRAHSPTWRPALGTDIIESDGDGTFAMKLPTGQYVLEASQAQFAGIDPDSAHVHIDAGGHTHADFTLAAGCVITGRVVGANGKPAGDGAIEKKWGDEDTQFGPAGSIADDGTFRWTTTDEADITLRAWPWKSPPSPSRTFACKDGARYPDVVFALPANAPDLDGVLVDRSGAPVPFAFIDLSPLDNGILQQERTDAQGKWAVYNMPAGRYQVIGYAPERGVVATTLVAPIHDARMQLGGTGRVEGTTTQLAEGSFMIELASCELGGGTVPLPHDPRLVTVSGGRFSIDGLPACTLSFTAQWQGDPEDETLEVPADSVAQLELDIGPPHAKTVHGVVRDETGRPIANAEIVSTRSSDPPVTAQTDATGHYSMSSFSGATIRALNADLVGIGVVGRANVADEQVDITVKRAPMPEDDVDF